MASFEIKKHNCFNCREEKTYIIDKPKESFECVAYPGGVDKLEPIYIEKDKVELEYTCKRCRCKNKIVVDL